MGTMVLLAAINAVVVTLTLAFGSGLASLRAGKLDAGVGSALVRFTLCSGVATFIFGFFVFYFGLPAMTGVYGGAMPFIVSGGIGIVVGAVVAFMSSADGDAQGMVGGYALVVITLILLFLIVVTPLNYLITVNGNVHGLGQLANVVMHDKADSIPQTDEKHLVLVTQGIAYAKGVQAIGSNGRNLGSTFETNQSDYTLQSINGHLYYIAPLDYRNVNQFTNYETPGYIKMDAEDPNADAVLVDTHPMHYTPQAMFGTDLDRHIYEAGYTHCNLLDSTLEVDDSGVPWTTVACATPKYKFTGNVIDSVLLVNPETGDITKYAPKDVPAWVDRVYDNDTITDYMKWWGQYRYEGWWNPSGMNQSVPANIDNNGSYGALQILYSKVNEEPVYVVPMTSSNGNDNSSTGMALCRTRIDRCDFYPLYGYGIGSAVDAAFKGAPGNIQKYSHEGAQLVNLYGRLAWITTYTTSSGVGDSFASVGIVDATPGRLTANNVIMDKTLSQALTDFQTYIATSGVPGAQPTATGNVKTLTASVTSIQSYVTGGKTVYALIFKGVPHVFHADESVYNLLPFVQAGDSVTITYIETGQSDVSIQSIKDQRLDTLITG
ncbi:MAG: hypothetical protein ACXWQ5_00965 [Ktedonobacterales bacterium]